MFAWLDTEFTDFENPRLISIGIVRDDDAIFYAELPPDNYEIYTSRWVQQNVISQLWGGSFRMSAETLADQLVAWFNWAHEDIQIATDSPEFDFEFLKEILKHDWPGNLKKAALRFDSFSLGQDKQPWLLETIEAFHSAERPAHHALYDAEALRFGMHEAMKRGWRLA